MAAIQTLCCGAQAVVRDLACCAPRGGPGTTRGGEGTHVVFVRRGAFVAHLGARAYVAEPCTALVARAGLEYRLSHPGAHGDDCTVLELAPEIADELLHRWRGVELPVTPALQLALAQLRAAPCEESAIELVGDALAAATLPPASAGRTQLVRRVRELLVADPAIAWSAPQLAARVGVSAYHLMRVFRAHTGMSLRAFRTQLRAALALHHVREGHADLAQLAAELGFASHAHLTTTFARTYGAPPRAFRSRTAGPRGRRRR